MVARTRTGVNFSVLQKGWLRSNEARKISSEESYGCGGGFMPPKQCAGYSRRCLGSRYSRNPSPIKLNARTVRAIAIPGKINACGAA